MTDAADDGVVETSRDGAILRITLNRPSRRNALSRSMTDTLVATLTAAATDDSLRAVHIRGEGSDFCAGVDWVASNAGERRPRTGDILRRQPHTAHRVVELVHTLHLPVVCTVRGWAAALGCNLALAADFTVAAKDAVFWEPFLGRGFSPDSGSTWLLPRLVGLARAKRMLLLGERVSGADAAQWGLIHAAVPENELSAVSDELVERLASGPTVAMGLAKQSMHYGQHASLSDTMIRELYNVELSCRTTDFKEGLTAFRDKRPPEFQGR
ncbi:enoyl-CoA hydratase [Mycolicibacterium acapulense]|uniref:enoyl-CoA hydratase/isomerase family protein n=1 Tax=Mycobacterium lehmannii TaxID=2048550 RepID=UPI0007465DC2|nr:enoyl-CoA hydratase-related protein [Mycobacterium lehmannii]KUI03819.1 enoyl-CoA hydratase [Mycolicibacterium acapulense]KUI09638.1 enoyl-CoA hydratase [Mycolicibacterium acapulense]